MANEAEIKIHLLAEVWEVLHIARGDAEQRRDGIMKDEDYAKALLNVELLGKIEKGELRSEFFTWGVKAEN